MRPTRSRAMRGEIIVQGPCVHACVRACGEKYSHVACINRMEQEHRLRTYIRPFLVLTQVPRDVIVRPRKDAPRIDPPTPQARLRRDVTLCPPIALKLCPRGCWCTVPEVPQKLSRPSSRKSYEGNGLYTQEDHPQRNAGSHFTMKSVFSNFTLVITLLSDVANYTTTNQTPWP
jgi:hypothetical protein